MAQLRTHNNEPLVVVQYSAEPQNTIQFPHRMPLSDFIAKHTTEAQCKKALGRSHCHKYFLKVLAVTATVSANKVANGKITKVGCRLNGKAR